MRWPSGTSASSRTATCCGRRSRGSAPWSIQSGGRDDAHAARPVQTSRPEVMAMSEAVKIDRSREAFIEDLRANNYTTYFVATHPKYAKGKGAFRFTSSPVSPADPCRWSYAETRRRLFELS